MTKSIVKLSAFIGFLSAAIYFFYFTEAGRSVTPQLVRDYIRDQEPVTARVLYVLLYVVGTVIMVPGTLISFAGAVVFGAWEGTLYTWIGATVGATCAFFMARWLGRDFVNQLLKGRFAQFDAQIRRRGFLGLLIIRLVPLFPFNGVNFGCGLTAMRPRDFILATAIGIIPLTFVYQYLFDRLGNRLIDEGLKWEYLWDPVLLGVVTLFVVLIVLGNWVGKKVSDRSTGVGEPGA